MLTTIREFKLVFPKSWMFFTQEQDEAISNPNFTYIYKSKVMLLNLEVLGKGRLYFFFFHFSMLLLVINLGI